MDDLRSSEISYGFSHDSEGNEIPDWDTVRRATGWTEQERYEYETSSGGQAVS